MASRSGGFQEGFEADPEVLSVLQAVEQGHLIEEHGAEGEALRTGEAARRHRAMRVEDALELAVEVLDGDRAQFVKDPADLDASVGMRIGAAAGSDQEATGGGAVVADGRVVVLGVAQDEAGRGRQLVEQAWGWLVVGGVGRGQLGGEWDPDGRDGGGQVELPAVDPAGRQGPRCTALAVPAGLGPAGLGVDRGVRDDTGVAVLWTCLPGVV